MNWFAKLLNTVSKVPNWLLSVTATVGGAAGAVAALGPLGLPAVVVSVATKIAVTSGTVAVIAAKALPGHGENRSLNAAPGVDPETPKAPR